MICHPLVQISLVGWSVLPSESSPSVPLHEVEREGLTPNFFVGQGLFPLRIILLPKGPPSPPGRGTEGEDSEGQDAQEGKEVQGGSGGLLEHPAPPAMEGWLAAPLGLLLEVLDGEKFPPKGGCYAFRHEFRQATFPG